ncbi:CCR4-NOT regulatory complex component [Puccinia graminis f. sp. tritici]|uniref:CCR4-NOT regulatory complex component n=1 Tax=Puccinia graminis f. sp. tritici TaxID=56615 RepID=A0A5B0PHT7_PUCGR|nr:CCR4-NOT regulatory complex component [Puccinia graminis f. sp. tritici]
MHQISDGERRRVQIVQGLMAPWNLLLLDKESLPTSWCTYQLVGRRSSWRARF